jgi:hypothetical protein
MFGLCESRKAEYEDENTGKKEQDEKTLKIPVRRDITCDISGPAIWPAIWGAAGKTLRATSLRRMSVAGRTFQLLASNSNSGAENREAAETQGFYGIGS